MSNIRSALAVSSYLPYTMSWIYRQISDPLVGTKLVISKQIENSDLFPFQNTYKIYDEPYWLKAVRGKLWFWFGNRTIRFPSSEKRKIERTLRENSIQLVHAHFGTFGIYLLDSCESLNIPLVVTFHGHDISSSLKRWPAYRSIFLEFLNRIKFAVVISEEMKERMIAIGCPSDKVRVSYLGVPTNEFSFVDRDSHQGPIRFLHAGRLTAKKGVPDLVKAFKHAFPEPDTAELWIAGDGEEKDLVVETIKQFKAEGSVKILGKVSNEELMRLRKEADVFVLNCRTDAQGTKEGLPIATLEAASTGLPCISTYHAGVPESVIHEKTGLLVKEYDNEALTKALLKMTNKEFRLSLGKQAREFMVDKFEVGKCNLHLNEIYKETLRK